MKRKIFILLILFIAIVRVFAQTDDVKYIRKGNKDYKNNKYKDAEINYRKSLEKNSKDNYKAIYNLGVALYKQGKYKEADSIFNIIKEAKMDDKQKAQLLHNIGNSQLQNKKYEDAVNSYKSSLKYNPKDKDTKYNLEYAKKMIVQQKQKQKQENKENKDNKQNQQKQQQQQDKKDEKQNQQKQQQPKMSKEDAKRMLEALNNNDKNVQDKLKKQKAAAGKGKVEKDW